jgi:uncharacterized protein with HEPN domain
MVGDLAIRLALVRCVEVIGEACSEVSAPVQLAMPGVPWHAMYGMCNRLIHDYGNTNYRIVFDVVSSDLPALIEQVEGFLRQVGEETRG